MIGKFKTGNIDYRKAISGKTTSKLIETGSLWELIFGIPKTSKLITFAPLRAEKPLSALSGPVLGVIEIVQNISEDYKTIFNFQVLVVLTIMLVMAILFLTLTFIVKKGEFIIEQRAREQIRLKEQLSQTQHLSSIGEMVAGVSHEIRNPLGIISSSAALLKKKVSLPLNYTLKYTFNLMPGKLKNRTISFFPLFLFSIIPVPQPRQIAALSRSIGIAREDCPLPVIASRATQSVMTISHFLNRSLRHSLCSFLAKTQV